ncbi:hypothetical protein pEaSNUABM54_00226 [Erwinia phage pEa_SNUABM_54]|nr:hypothetical protein pEaSNUABM54_00226 [Erwinia phage pEa_SNUABM_54]
MKAELALYCKVGDTGYCHSFEVEGVRYSITCEYANNYYEAAKHLLAWNDWKCDKPISKEVQVAIRECLIEALETQLGWNRADRINRRDFVHDSTEVYQLSCDFDLSTKRIRIRRDRVIDAETSVSSTFKMFVPFDDTRSIGELIDLVR